MSVSLAQHFTKLIAFLTITGNLTHIASCCHHFMLIICHLPSCSRNMYTFATEYICLRLFSAPFLPFSFLCCRVFPPVHQLLLLKTKFHTYFKNCRNVGSLGMFILLMVAIGTQEQVLKLLSHWCLQILQLLSTTQLDMLYSIYFRMDE